MSVIDTAVADPVVRATLERAGWTPVYHYALEPDVHRLTADGFSVSPQARDVLSLLGGLRIVPPVLADAKFASGTLLMNPLWAALGESERIHARETALRISLSPVGEWMDQFIVLVAGDGRIIGETTTRVVELGTDMGDALIRIIKATSAPRVMMQGNSSF